MQQTVLRFLVVVGFAATLASPVAAQPLSFGAPIAVDDPVYEPGPGPHIVGMRRVGSEYLVYDASEAVRLRSDGTAVDTAPFAIPRTVEVACSDAACLMLQADATGVFFQRMQPDGTLLDASPVSLASDAGAIIGAWRGAMWIVAWWSVTNSRMEWVHVRPDGTILERTPHSQASMVGNEVYPSGLDCGSTQCLLAFRSQEPTGGTSTTRVLRIDSTGASLDPAGITVFSNHYRTARVSHQGSWYLVHLMNVFGTAYGGIRVTTDGRVLDASPIRLGTEDAENHGCNTSGCLIIDHVGLTVVARLLEPDGTLGPDRILHRALSPEFPEPGFIQCDASACLAVWDDRPSHIMRSIPTPLDGILARGATVLTPVARPNAQDTPALASGETNLLSVWADRRGGNSTLRGGRIAGGVALDPAGILLSDGASTSITVPSLAFGAGLYAAVWVEAGDLYFRRVASDGSLPGGSPIRLDRSDVRAATIDYDGTDFFVVFRHGGDVVARRVSPSGATLERSFFVIEAGVGTPSPASAFDGTNHLVVWNERRSRGQEIYGRRVGRDGAALDVLSIPIGSADGDQTLPSVSYGDGVFMVVWRDSRLPDRTGVYAARVGTDGGVMDPLGIPVRAVAGVTVTAPEVAWDGTQFIVAWQETERVEDPPDSGSVRFDQYFASSRLGADGRLLDATPTRVVASELSSGVPPRLAAGPAGAAVAYTDTDTTYSERRVFVRELGAGAAGGACTDDSDCASGVCTGSSCCDRACDGSCEACTEGVCSVLATGTLCRATSGAMCDIEETCDGTSALCPADEPMTGCDAGAGTVSDAGVPVDDSGAASADGGTRSDSGAAAGLDAGAEPPGGGGCSAVGGPEARPGVLLFLIAALLCARRRRPRAARRPG